MLRAEKGLPACENQGKLFRAKNTYADTEGN